MASTRATHHSPPLALRAGWCRMWIANSPATCNYRRIGRERAGRGAEDGRGGVEMRGELSEGGEAGEERGVREDGRDEAGWTEERTREGR